MFERKDFNVSELMTADEIMLTSATKEIIPITSGNGIQIGGKKRKGKPGQIFKKLRKAYTNLMLLD